MKLCACLAGLVVSAFFFFLQRFLFVYKTNFLRESLSISGL
ncbi:hypothetical protein HMPREF1869_00776 [Bacteroidales bacterium KA00251]|nr:hypothetical protein HMPREF1869_00776 [Bacteroidales bacterium KA00251]